ncbi:MAG TPA: hypothetical protein VLH35_06185 [Candidatus Acidoferrales bacterium]|nr:hypothetical protein [Candidatus Acidoferrales bacterium]
MKPKQKAALTTLLLISAMLFFTQFVEVSAFPAGSMAQEAVRILQNHDKATGLNSTELIAMLDYVNESQYMSVTNGNITLTVTKWGPRHFVLSNGIRCDDDTVYTYFEWVYVYNGVEYNRVKVTFSNGAFSRFDDDRSTHPIGSINIGIPKEQAIETAKVYISGFIDKYNLTIANVSAVLDSTWNETGWLHPFWGVKIVFDQNVSGVHVYVWADSGLVHWSYRDNGSPFKGADYPATATVAPAQLAATETPSVTVGEYTTTSSELCVLIFIAVSGVALFLAMKRKSRGNLQIGNK